VATIVDKLANNKNGDAIGFAIEHHFLPSYFLTIHKRLLALKEVIENTIAPNNTNVKMLGGGTDLYVQQHDTMVDSNIDFLFDNQKLKGITQVGNICYVGAAATVTDLLESPIFLQFFPNLQKHIKLVSSTPIRNMATIAGNFVNASPIGDFTIFFLALNAQVVLNKSNNSRVVPLQQLYKGYKQLAKEADEYVAHFYFELPTPNSFFNFEKVCKRTHLDIASVNTAINITTDNKVIVAAHLSAGGIGPIPTYLHKATNYLIGKTVDVKTVSACIDIATTEIAPISDARGTAAYKSFLLEQLIKAHFIELFGLHFN
jgi:xanthine dehydrogenase small subunit